LNTLLALLQIERGREQSEIERRIRQELDDDAATRRKEWARRGGKARHQKDKDKQETKRAVYELFVLWHQEPQRYRSASELARDAQEKWPEQLKVRTVEAWLSDWKQGRNLPS
jgi:hypothetical protein